MSNDAIRRQAERLLTLALQQRQRGSSELADEFVARAMQLFDEANGLVDEAEGTTPVPSSAPSVPQPQQQQQQRLGRKEGGEEE
jgi:hypothetical protein